MGKHLLFSAVLFLVINFSSAQNTKADMKVMYNMKVINDSTNRANLYIVDNLVLLFNNDMSIYYNQDAIAFNNAIKKAASKVQVQNGKIEIGKLPIYPKSKGSVYKVNNVVKATIPVGRYFYTFEEPELHWTLLPETKEINGILCNHAKVTVDTGDTFYAWYANQYPFSEGPFRFKGLPGLILQVYNKSNTIELSAVEIKKASGEEITDLKSQSITVKNKETFLKARRQFFDNPNIQNDNDRNIIMKMDTGEILNNKPKGKLPNNVFLD